MKPVNVKLTVSQAAKELGYSSRSTLYNLIKKGYLNNYLWVDDKGRKNLEMNPFGSRSLKTYLPAIIKLRSDCVQLKKLRPPHEKLTLKNFQAFR